VQCSTSALVRVENITHVHMHNDVNIQTVNMTDALQGLRGMLVKDFLLRFLEHSNLSWMMWEISPQVWAVCTQSSQAQCEDTFRPSVLTSLCVR